MSLPFAADTWKKIADNPMPGLFGPLSGPVGGIDGAAYHPASETIQILSRAAHSFVKFFNTAAISFDGGRTWGDTYRGDLVPEEAQEQVFGAFSLDTDAGLYHYQIRINAQHSFFVADGTLQLGGIALYVANHESVAFVKQQQLYSWPHVIADPANTGGQNIFQWFPSATNPLKIAGSGPAGEDAYWMVVSVGLQCGGTNNRTFFNFQDLWRSIDGLVWEKVADLNANPGMQTYFQLSRSTSGRFLMAGANIATTNDGPDLSTATWTLASGVVGDNGSAVVPMYGGTWAATRWGSLIANGFVRLSCNDGSSFFANPDTPFIPINSAALVMKLGPAEMLLITTGFVDPATQTASYYSSDGGETFTFGGVWLSTTIGERPVAGFIKQDGHPLVVTRDRLFVSTDKARGIITGRTQCPLANAGLAAARPLRLCGLPLTPVCKD